MSDYIVQDLLLMILKRLPVEALLRCRAVCKSWKELIASKSFILSHLAVQKRSIIAQELDVPSHKLNYHLFDPRHLPLVDHLDVRIVVNREDRHSFTFSTVDGVVCVYNNVNFLFLCNPSTRQLMRIPVPESSTFSTTDFKYCGFSIDPSTNDFKIVIFCIEAEIAVLYSSKEQVWTEVSMGDVGDSTSESNSPQVMVDGVAHWTAYDADEMNPGFIISFDFKQHKFETMVPIEYATSQYLYLCKWQDLLSVMHCDICFPDPSCELWVMQNGLWSQMFKFDLHQDTMWVYCVLQSTGRVLAYHETKELVIYDPKDGFIDLGTYSDFRSYTFSYDFVESLVFPDQISIYAD